MDKKAAFVDTMTFLHFRPLNEIDWTARLESDEVELLLAPVVLRELNCHKDRCSTNGSSLAKGTERNGVSARKRGETLSWKRRIRAANAGRRQGNPRTN